MAFRFKKSESPGRAVRRVCRERSGKAIAALRRSGSPAAIHEARKEIKKVRAALALVNGEPANRAGIKAAKSLRKAARRLAASRDARVRLRVFEGLAEGVTARFPQLHDALREHSRRESWRLKSSNDLRKAERFLRAARSGCRGLKISGAGWAMIGPGLKRTLSRGEKAFAIVRARPDSGNLHRWRKRVKELWHQMALLGPAWSRTTRRLLDELAVLGGQLGEEHDLSLLKEFIGRWDEAGERRAIGRLVDTRQKGLRTSVVKLGKRFFGGQLAGLPARLEREWNAWRRHCC
jgi:CHAD domain-containing protein